MQVGDIDISRPKSFRRQTPRIGAWTAMMEFVAAPMRQRETLVALTDASKRRGHVGQLVCDEMHHLAFPLYASMHKVTTSATAYLGIGTYQVAMLVKAKLIRLTEAAQNGQHGAIHVATLEAFVDRLMKNARTVKQKTGYQATLADASRRAMFTQVDIVNLISEGRLKWIGVREGSRHYGSILVDWQEVRSLIHELGRDTLSLREFADQIQVRKQAAGALVAQGHVASVFKVCGGHRTIRIQASEAIAFRQRYVSLGELACNRNQHHQTTKKMLDKRGVKPAFDPDAVLAHIYLSSQSWG